MIRWECMQDLTAGEERRAASAAARASPRTFGVRRESALVPRITSLEEWRPSPTSLDRFPTAVKLHSLKEEDHGIFPSYVS